MAHATKLVPFRVNFIYMISIVFITILVPSNDDRLLGGSGVAASPFVIAIQDAGIRGLGDVVNACMMLGVLAIAAESVYLSSRILRTMAHQKLVPERLAKVDDKGRPRLALLITCGVAVLLGYIQLSCKSMSCTPLGQVLISRFNSWRPNYLELVDFNHQCFILYELDHYCLYQLAFPLCTQSTERPLIQRSLCVEVLLLALGSRMAYADLLTSARMLYRCWH